MSVLVKLGGTLLDAPDSRRAIAIQLAAAHKAAPRLVVVHGGGKQMTRFLAERGVESRFVGGLRVTTPDVIDAVLKVFAGSVNKELTAALIAAGAPAVGLSGIDGLLAQAEVMDPALGQVGRIVATNPGLLHVLLASDFLPVVACVAAGADGTVFNVNADQMAVACAAALPANRLIFLTDVEGVRGADGRIAHDLTAAQSLALIESGVATGGMEAKLRASIAALHAGVGEVTIAAGSSPDILPRLLGGHRAGTRVLP